MPGSGCCGMLCRWLVPFHSGPWVCTSSAWADEMAKLQWACTSYKYCVLTWHGDTIWYIQLLIFNIHVFFIELGLVSTQLTNSTWVVYGSSRICKKTSPGTWGGGGKSGAAIVCAVLCQNPYRPKFWTPRPQTSGVIIFRCLYYIFIVS